MATIPSRKSLNPSGKRRRNRIGIVVFSLISLILIGELLVAIVIPMVKGFISTRVTSDRYLVLTLPDPMGADNIAIDHTGTLWFADRSHNKVGKIALDRNRVTEYTLPNAYTGSEGPDDNLWFFITIGSDGNPWFTLHSPKYGYTLAKITSSGQVTNYSMSSRADMIGGITLGPDGNVWFTATGNAGDFVGNVTPTGHITVYPVPSKSGGVGGITPGPDGNLWFTEANAKIGRITPDGSITEFALEKGSVPRDITKGPDGNIWFTLFDGMIEKISPDGKKITKYVLPHLENNPMNIIAGPDGNLWLTENGPGGAYIGRITPAGVVTEFHEGYGDFQYASLAFVGNDLWFAIGFASAPGKIGRMPIK